MKIIKGIFIFIILATIVYYINPKNLIYISGKEYNLNILYFLPFALILFLSVDNFIIKRKNISIVTIQNIKLLIKVSTIWIAWIILCTVFNHIIYRDFDKYITESILALIKWTSGFLVLITGTIFIKWHEKELKTALILMMIAALFVQLYLIFIKDLYNNFAYLTRGFAYLYWKEIGKNELSGSLVLFLLIALSLLIHQKKDISITFFIVFILTGLACIVFLMSREGFLTLFIGIVTFIFLRKVKLKEKIIESFFLILLLLLIFASPMGKYFLESLNEANIDPNEASTYRLERWSTGIKFFLLNPVFGLGLNGYRYMGIQKGYIGEAAHNSYIHSLTVSGIIGGIIFLYFIKTIYKAIKYKNNGYESIFIKSIKVALLSFLTGYITSAFFSDHFFNFNYLNIILFGITSIYLNIRYT